MDKPCKNSEKIVCDKHGDSNIVRTEFLFGITSSLIDPTNTNQCGLKNMISKQEVKNSKDERKIKVFEEHSGKEIFS